MALCAEIETLISNTGAQRYLIDMPMGLPEKQIRDLESIARAHLPGRASSVFSVPTRSAVYAKSYQAACDMNARQQGKKISIQAWNICPKIQSIDQLLRDQPQLTDLLYESHPEICFSRLNGKPLVHTKKSAEGIQERLGILGGRNRAMPALFEQALQKYPRKLLARDDVLDAMVLMLTAAGRCLQLRGALRQDEYGIPIRMLVPATDSND
jgi:predicted RNase H-like nuclease